MLGLKLKRPLELAIAVTVTLSGFDIWLIEAETNGRHFADDTLEYIFWNENIWNSIKVSLKFISKCPIDNKPAFIQILAWRWPGD